MKEELRVGIVGSRRRCTLRDRKLVFNLVERIIELNPHREVVIVSGACRLGADNFAAEAAKLYGIQLKEFPVPKREYAHRGEYAKEAFARNLLIAQDSHVGFAFVHPDRDGGTENTVGHYHNLKKKVFLVDAMGRTYLSTMDERNLFDVARDPDKS
jgi:hypothetical protein